MGSMKKITTLGLMGALLFMNLATVQADTSKIMQSKLAGSDRYKTAVEISKSGWNTSNKAILVNGTALPDALCVAPLADEYNAPILLTEKDRLNSDTLNELKRLGVKEVTIIGSENVVSISQETALKSNGISVQRIGGKDRYDTSLKISEMLKPIYQSKGQGKTVFIANGVKGLADATSVSSTAGIKDAYILYSNGTNLSGINSFIETSADNVYLIGGTSVISQQVENILKSTTNKAIHRLAGLDRKDTNAKVVGEFFTNKELNNTYVAKDGMSQENELVDALAVGALASKNGSPVVLSSGNLGNTQRNLVIDKEFNNVIQVGEGSNRIAVQEIIDIKSKPTSIDFSTFAGKLPGMGFDEIGIYWENDNLMGSAYADSSGAGLVLYQNSSSFNSVVKNCLNMLLPTGGNKVYDIISGKFNNQTLNLDGRRVEIEQFPQGVSIEIYDN